MSSSRRKAGLGRGFFPDRSRHRGSRDDHRKSDQRKEKSMRRMALVLTADVVSLGLVVGISAAVLTVGAGAVVCLRMTNRLLTQVSKDQTE